jgi:hypothetical protein
VSGSRNALLGDWFQPPDDPQANVLLRQTPLAPRPSYASAADQAWAAIQAKLDEQQRISQERGLWTGGQVWEGGHPTTKGAVDATRQVGDALLMGTTTPGLRAFHGSLEDFSTLDRSKVGSGAMSDRWTADAKHADEYYLTTNPEHAEHYGPVVHEFEIGKPLYQKDAKADLEAWAKSEGYDSAQKHLDEYYDGNIYSALDMDNYLKDALSEAKAAGFPGVHVSLGDLKNPRRKAFGDFIVLHDPSVATRVAARQRKD